MITKNLLRVVALSVAGFGALSLGGCGGEVAAPEADLQVSDTDTTSAALASPDPSAGTGGTSEADDDGDDDGDHRGGPGGKGDHKKGDHKKGDHEKGDKGDCNDRDHGGHAHHRHHKFKVLDGIDGATDGVVTIASLPPALPARLIARLHKIDADGNGLVTKDEVKAWIHAHDHGG